MNITWAAYVLYNHFHYYINMLYIPIYTDLTSSIVSIFWAYLYSTIPLCGCASQYHAGWSAVIQTLHVCNLHAIGSGCVYLLFRCMLLNLNILSLTLLSKKTSLASIFCQQQAIQHVNKQICLYVDWSKAHICLCGVDISLLPIECSAMLIWWHLKLRRPSWVTK